MNKRRLKKLIKRLRHLPQGKYFFKYALNKVKHLYYKLTKSTKVAYPSTVMLELSSHCNLKCTTCPREYGYGASMFKGYMPVEKAKSIIDELWPYLDSIGLTGMGETFLYDDLLTVVDYIKTKNKGIIISVSTNAVIPNFIGKITPFVGKIDTVQISIDGIGDVYETIRHNSSFDTLDKNLTQLVSLFKNTETTFMLNMVVTKENYKQMSEMVAYAETKGIKYLNYTLFNLASVTDIPIAYYDFYSSPEFIHELKLLDITRAKIKNVEISNWDYDSLNEFQKCNLPWSHFAICANGDLPPCCAKPFPEELNFGNVLEEGVLTVLNAPKFQRFRASWYKNQTPPFCEKCHFIDLKPVKYTEEE